MFHGADWWGECSIYIYLCTYVLNHELTNYPNTTIWNKKGLFNRPVSMDFNGVLGASCIFVILNGVLIG